MATEGYTPDTKGKPQGDPPTGGSATATPPPEQPQRKLKLRLDGMGYGTVEIDGIELAAYTQDIRIRTHAGEGTEVTIGLAPGMQIDLETDAGKLLAEIAPELAPEDEA